MMHPGLAHCIANYLERVRPLSGIAGQRANGSEGFAEHLARLCRRQLRDVRSSPVGHTPLKEPLASTIPRHLHEQQDGRVSKKRPPFRLRCARGEKGKITERIV